MTFRDPPTRRGPGPPVRADDLVAVADVLLSSPPAAPAGPAPGGAEAEPAAPAATAAAPARARPDVPPAPADPPRGLYLLVPAGVDPGERRPAALRAARCLAPRRRPTGVLLLEAGRVDAHVLGETASGRLGPQNYLGPADLDQALRRLAGQCDPIALVPLDAAGEAVGWVGPARDRPVLVVGAGDEGLMEAYRTLKAWRRRNAAAEASVLYLGTDGGRATALHDRLRRAARAFLHCDPAMHRPARGGNGDGLSAGPDVRAFAGAPAAAVWAALRTMAGETGPDGADHRSAPAAGPAAVEPPPAAGRPVVAAPPREETGRMAERTDGPPPAPRAASAKPAARAAFAVWTPESRDDLLGALEGQLPGRLGGSLRRVFRVDVDEPGAPPLAGVRDDGALVAILLAGPDEAVDTRAAERWMRVHWSLLARRRAGSGEVGEPKVAVVALAPARRSASDGLRRFVPVRLGGHRGIVLLP